MATENDLRRALEELCSEPDPAARERVARMARKTGQRSLLHRWRLAIRGLIAAFVAALFVTPLGPALAETVGDGVSGIAQLFAAETENLEPHRPAGSDAQNVDFFIEGTTSPQVVRRCEKTPGAFGDPLQCELILAVAEGRLEPGGYSRGELKHLLGR